MTRKELKKSIPYGYGKVIAKKANVSERAVSLFLQGKSNSIKIEMTVLRVLAELADQRKELTEKIN